MLWNKEKWLPPREHWKTSFEEVEFSCHLKGGSYGVYGARIGARTLDGDNSLSASVEKGKVTMCDALRTALIPWSQSMCIGYLQWVIWTTIA